MPVEEPVQAQSFLGWMIESLGPFYALAIPLAGVVAFVVTCIAVGKVKRPGSVAAYAVIAAAPVLLGLFGTVSGALQSLAVVANASVAPKPSEVSGGIATALFTLLVGMMAAFPAYAVCCLGILVRTFRGEDA